MRSLIILEVEHGEDTDPIDTAVSLIQEGLGGSEIEILDYTVRVDLPECFRLDS